MASSSFLCVPKRVLFFDLTIDDEEVNKCVAGAKRVTRERDATVVVEKKQKSITPQKAVTKVDYDEDELVEEVIKMLQRDIDAAGDCLRLVLEHYVPDPELNDGAKDDPFVWNAEQILKDVEHFCCF